MVDNKKILLHKAEMAEHANGAAQYLGALLGGRYVTKLTFFLLEQRGISKVALLRPKKKRTQRYTEGNT